MKYLAVLKRLFLLLWLGSTVLNAQITDEAVNRSLNALQAGNATADDPEISRLITTYRSQVPELYRRYEQTTEEYKRIEAQFAEAGIPPYFALIPYCESKFNPSRKGYGTAGLWQFSAQSARNFGLTVKKGHDERLDPGRSTEAAIRYIKSLKRQFGSWYLVDFAYAMGEGTLYRMIRKNGSEEIQVLLRDPHFPSGTKAHFAKTLLLDARIHHSDPVPSESE